MDLSLENLVLQRMPVGEVESPKRTSDGGGGWGWGLGVGVGGGGWG